MRVSNHLRHEPMATATRTLGACVLGLFVALTPLPGQSPATDSKRSQATRAELESQLAELDQIVSSPGYSGRLRGAKRAEAELIRLRLAEGDLQVGDQVNLLVQGDSTLTGTYAVAAGRVLVFPGIAEIPVKGVLRSEVQDYLTTRLRQYIREPQVRAQTLIRLSVFGGVNKPGFYQLPAEQLAGDAIMAAGGPAAGVQTDRTVIRRSGVEIWSRTAFQEALVQGQTLDQLNLRAGDEIYVGVSRRTSVINYIPILTGITSLSYLLARVL